MDLTIPGLDAFLTSMMSAGAAVRSLVIAIFMYGVGWFYLGSSAWRLAKFNAPQRQYGAASVVVRAIIGACFIQANSYLNMVVNTVTGASMPDVTAMSVMPVGGATAAAKVFGVALAWLGVLGVIAILRGGQLIVKGVESSGHATEQDPIFTGFVFIFSGAIGVNLWRFVGNLF